MRPNWLNKKLVVSVAAAAPSGGPKGTLTMAVGDINYPSGLPRFCTAGCSV